MPFQKKGLMSDQSNLLSAISCRGKRNNERFKSITASNTITTQTLIVRGDAEIDGKLTVDGLIDPTGLVLTEQTSAPTTPLSTEGILWVESTSPNRLMFTDGEATDNNVFLGEGFTDTSNTALGDDTLDALTTGARNTAIGVDVLRNLTTGSDNTGVGDNALAAHTGSQCTAVGSNTLEANTSGVRNTAIGFDALLVNTTGIDNTAVGTTALSSNTTGDDNVGIGRTALSGTTSGSSNTAIGFAAGNNNTTGNSNTFLGSGADASSGTLSNAAAIGAGATVSSSDQIHLGNTALATAVRLGGTQYQSSGAVSTTASGVLTTASDARLKTIEGKLTNTLEKVRKLEGVYFKWKDSEKFDDVMNIGLIAQQVEPYFPELVGTSKTPDKIKSFQYNYFTAVLLEAIKELADQVDEIKKKLL